MYSGMFTGRGVPVLTAGGVFSKVSILQMVLQRPAQQPGRVHLTWTRHHTYTLELSTNIREVSQCPEKDPSREGLQLVESLY